MGLKIQPYKPTYISHTGRLQVYHEFKLFKYEKTQIIFY